MSVSRRPSASIRSPYRRAWSRSWTTPAARFCAADRMTASGVRSSCDTVATKSICCAASFSERRALRRMRPTLTRSVARIPKLRYRFRTRRRATAASSDPAACCSCTRQPLNRTAAVGTPSRCTTTENCDVVDGFMSGSDRTASVAGPGAVAVQVAAVDAWIKIGTQHEERRGDVGLRDPAGICRQIPCQHRLRRRIDDRDAVPFGLREVLLRQSRQNRRPHELTVHLDDEVLTIDVHAHTLVRSDAEDAGPLLGAYFRHRGTAAFFRDGGFHLAPRGGIQSLAHDDVAKSAPRSDQERRDVREHRRPGHRDDLGAGHRREARRRHRHLTLRRREMRRPGGRPEAAGLRVVHEQIVLAALTLAREVDRLHELRKRRRDAPLVEFGRERVGLIGIGAIERRLERDERPCQLAVEVIREFAGPVLEQLPHRVAFRDADRADPLVLQDGERHDQHEQRQRQQHAERQTAAGHAKSLACSITPEGARKALIVQALRT